MECNADDGTCVTIPCRIDADCDDEVFCTVDICETDGSCINIPDDVFCDDGLFCTSVDVCKPDHAGADYSGCVNEGDPCAGGGICDDDADSCQLLGVVVRALGSRHVEVVVDDDIPGIDFVSIKVTSPSLPCLSKYVDRNGRLRGEPTYRSPSEWNTVVLYGDEIVPAAEYRIQLEMPVQGSLLGRLVGDGTATTRNWADVVSAFGVIDFDDIAVTIDCFTRSGAGSAFERCDIYPAITDGQVDFSDIASVVDAFVGGVYPFAVPCGNADED